MILHTSGIAGTDPLMLGEAAEAMRIGQGVAIQARDRAVLELHRRLRNDERTRGKVA